jgi:hypothetical protein
MSLEDEVAQLRAGNTAKLRVNFARAEKDAIDLCFAKNELRALISDSLETLRVDGTPRD